jgi:HAD superfamily phosphatase (TIGR01681 family)
VIAYGGIMLAHLSHVLGMKLPGPTGTSTKWTINYREPLYLDEPARITLEISHTSSATGLVEAKFRITSGERTIATGNDPEPGAARADRGAARVASMPDRTLFPWRAPLSADWSARWKAADALVRALKTDEHDASAATELCVAVRRLANERLGVSEQLKLEGLARRMLPNAARLPGFRAFRIGLLGNRTLSFLVNPLRAAGLGRGLLIDVVEAPYDSAASFAFGDAGPFAAAALDSVVVVLDEGAFGHAGKLLDGPGEDRAVNDALAFLQRAAAVSRDALGVPAIVATLPAAGATVSSADVATAGTAARFVARINAGIAAGGATGDWVVWDLAGLAARVGHDAWFDPARFHEAKTPFAIELCPLVADHLSRIVAAMTGKSARALVLDLDNTLWGGVIGDDGLAGIRLGQNSAEGEAYVAFQRYVLDLRDRGIVLAVCSKNTDEIAREPFRSHPEMILREHHVAVFQANWEDKASNVQAIAEALNLGLESLVFVDDNPAERERVRQELPLVCVPEIGSEPRRVSVPDQRRRRVRAPRAQCRRPRSCPELRRQCAPRGAADQGR